MSAYPNKASGGCLCGSIRYELMTEPDYVAFCHCETCRKATGAPAVVYSVYLDKNVNFTKGERKTYQSSLGVSRTFCGDCGTPLSYESEWQGDVVIGFFVGTLDEPDLFPPQRHVFHSERVKWFDAADKLPRFLGVPKAGKKPDSIGSNA